MLVLKSPPTSARVTPLRSTLSRTPPSWCARCAGEAFESRWQAATASGPSGRRDLRQQRALLAEPFLRGVELVADLGDIDVLDAPDRIAREDGRARQRQGVLEAGRVVAEVVGEREVRNTERVAHAEGLGQLARDVAVARAPETDVHLAEQEQVGPGERRRHDGTPQVIEPRAPLDVPGHGPQRPPARRRRGRRRRPAPNRPAPRPRARASPRRRSPPTARSAPAPCASGSPAAPR